MFTRSLLLCCLILSSLNAFASDVDMLRLQQLLKASEQQELSEIQRASAPTQENAATVQKTVSLQHINMPKRVLIDVRSDHSDGKHNMSMLIELAKKRGVDALAFTEHDRYSIRFGIDPMPNILGYAMQHPSLYVTGLDYFFSDLNRQRALHPEIQLFAGTESTPGYTWSGIPFKNLTLHNAERHFITLGIEKPEQIEGLSSYDLRHAYGNRAISLAFWCGLVFILIIIFMRRRKRGMALLLMASFIAFLTSWLMKPTIDADVDFIDTAHEQGLFVIWTHPGTLSGVRKGPMGIQLDTPPYNQRVFKDPTADAFAAVYGDTDQNTVAGGLWDRYMMDYMRGYHKKPIWAVAAGDYHEEGMANEYLGNFPMDVWSDTAKPHDILTAMRQGHMAAWGMTKRKNIAIKALYLEDANGLRLLSGDEAVVRPPLHMVAALTDTMQASKEHETFQGEWIVDGHIVQTTPLKVNAEQVKVIPLQVAKGEHVVRLQIKQGLRMIANPFLVHIK
ncbi:MAG: hypothetical protein Q9M21_09390 [Mariprofundaceae bacterium]|nr:hypothetical protein [Mariprofundaceae bacterium]